MANLNGLGGGTSSTQWVARNSPWYSEMAKKWVKVNHILAGAEVMRKNSSLYLPQFPLERDSMYEWRVKTATFTNFSKHMIDQMVGKIFSKPIEISTPIPDEIIQNIDRQGNSLEHVARQLCFDLISKGLAHNFVDFPKIQGEVTKREMREKNIRPFFVRISPENLFGATASESNDDDDFMSVRWREDGVDVLGFDERSYEKIRVVCPKYDLTQSGEIIRDEYGQPIITGMKWQLWEYNMGRLLPRPKDKIISYSSGYVLVEEGDFGLSRIPLVTAYADKTAFMESNLPMEDIYFLNIKHFQASSDLDNIIRLSQAPIIFSKGLQDKDPLEAKGSDVVFNVEGDADELEACDMKYVEISGKGIEAGERMIGRIVSDAQMIGIRMFERKRSIETATGELLEKQDDASPLQLMALSLESQLKRSLDFMCEWLNLPKENKVKVNKDFAFTKDETKAVEALQLAWAQGAIQSKTYLSHLKDFSILKSDLDVEEESRLALEEYKQRGARTLTYQGVQGANANETQNSRETNNDNTGNATQDATSGNE